MKINDVEFTPQEIQAVLIALDRMENEELDSASAVNEATADADDLRSRDLFMNEANVARDARNKFLSSMLNTGPQHQ